MERPHRDCGTLREGSTWDRAARNGTSGDSATGNRPSGYRATRDSAAWQSAARWRVAKSLELFSCFFRNAWRISLITWDPVANRESYVPWKEGENVQIHTSNERNRRTVRFVLARSFRIPPHREYLECSCRCPIPSRLLKNYFDTLGTWDCWKSRTGPETPAGCSKRPSSHPPNPGAPRRAFPRARPQRARGRGVHTALRVNRSPIVWILANGETPSGVSLFALDPLHHENTAMGAPTKLADFFNILLVR